LGLAEAMSWACTMSWAMAVLVCLCRIATGADFRLVLTEQEVSCIVDPPAPEGSYDSSTHSPPTISTVRTLVDVHSPSANTEILVDGV